MKAIILAAGYATRLGELTKNMPKALLNIGGKPILNYICDQIDTIDDIDEIYVVSNEKFYSNFVQWSESFKSNKKIVILNDGSTTDENKLGGVGDMEFAVSRAEIDDDVIVIAGDNFFTYNLKDFYEYFQNIKCNCICVKKGEDIKDLKRMGVAELDSENKIIGFEEKPQEPKSDVGVYATYIYNRETLPLIKEYLQQGNNPDAPGYFPAWLFKRRDLYGYSFKGDCYDIGTVESYKKVNEKFS